MGHIQKRGERKYLARWHDPDGRERAKTFTRKLDAERHITKMESAKLRGDYVDQSNTTTVLEYARTYAALRPHRPTSAARYANYIEHHIAGTQIAAVRLPALRPSQVQAWATDRAALLAPITVRHLVSFLRSVMDAAVEDRLASSNPVSQRVKLPRVREERIVPLTVEEVQALADAMPERCRAMVITQAGLGLRIGELLGLRLEDVDFLHRSVLIDHQLGNDGREFGPTKNSVVRTVPLPVVVAEALAAHIASYPPGVHGLLFTSTADRPFRKSYYGAQIFPAAVRRAGLVDVTSHHLRHHYASVLLHAGESVVAVAERIGDTPAMVLATYGHMMPDSEDRTRRAIDAAWTTDGLQTDSAHG
jgi:integrase